MIRKIIEEIDDWDIQFSNISSVLHIIIYYYVILLLLLLSSVATPLAGCHKFVTPSPSWPR